MGCSDKMKRCIAKVKARGGKYNAYAVCKSSVGKKKSVKKKKRK
jgi:hypothetical protein